MTRYFFASILGHTLVFGLLISLGALLSKPRMSYYSVDLFSAMPSGSVAPATAVTQAPVSQAPAPPAPPEVPAPKEAIKVPDKSVKKQKTVVKPKPKPKEIVQEHKKPEPRKSLSDLMYGETAEPAKERATGGAVGSSNIVAEAGPTFPYPWYLKTVTDRVDKQWNPPSEFAAEVVCQVMFSIGRDGHISDQKIEKTSSDSFFDQLALRAVMYSNPLPPLPSGYPGETLRVHLKFVGKEN